MRPQRYRKKPVEVEAMRWPADGDNYGNYENACRISAIHRWVWDNGGKTWVVSPKSEDDVVHVVIETLEGNMRIGHGDYVIRGINGEFYPCKPDIFDASYEAVS